MSRCPRGTLGLGGSLKGEGPFNSDVVFFFQKTFSVLGLVGWGSCCSSLMPPVATPIQVPFRAYPHDFQKSIVVVGLKIDKVRGV